MSRLKSSHRFKPLHFEVNLAIIEKKNYCRIERVYCKKKIPLAFFFLQRMLLKLPSRKPWRLADNNNNVNKYFN